MKLKKIVVFSTTFLLGLFFIVGCSEQDATTGSEVNYVSFEYGTAVLGVEANATAAKTIKVWASNTSSVDRVFDVVVNQAAVTLAATSALSASLYTFSPKVTIPANSKEGEITVNVTGTNIGAGKEIFLTLTPQVGTGVGKLNIKVNEVCNKNVVRLELALDRYGAETTYELYNSNLEVVASGGPWTNIATNTAQPLKTFDFCLEAGSYTFVIYDSEGDGICCTYGAGSYKLSRITETGATAIATGGQFGEFETQEFTIQ